MNALSRKNKQGFTIIEVVLVLAIAALIFLMVFIALPALQRGQRDTARKSVLSKLASGVTSFESNNRGHLPDVGTPGDAKILGNYIDASPEMSDWGSPDINTPNIDNQYSLYGADNGHLPTPATNEANILYYIPKAECGPDGAVPVVSPRKAAVETLVENSNFSQWFCEAV